MDREAVKSVLRGQEIGLPSWAFGDSGTRFKVFGQPGVPRDPYEKIAEAVASRRHELSRSGRPARPAGPSRRVAAGDLRAAGPQHRLLIEYKFFEPHFYAMDIRTGERRCCTASRSGEQAHIVLDTGHHAPGTNIEFIVMQLLQLTGAIETSASLG